MTIKLEVDLVPRRQQIVTLLQQIAAQGTPPKALPPAIERPQKPAMSVTSDTGYMAEKDVAKRLGVSLGTVRRWRMLATGPRFAKFGQLVRYRQSDIDRWAEARLIDSTRSQ